MVTACKVKEWVESLHKYGQQWGGGFSLLPRLGPSLSHSLLSLSYLSVCPSSSSVLCGHPGSVALASCYELVLEI